MRLKNTLLNSLVFLTTLFVFSQAEQNKLIQSYESYSTAPREVVYAHLNKSVYVEGEMLGFNAYVFDKFTKERFLVTSNLYCTITDEDGKVIKEKLVLVENGVAYNVFNIDSTFTKPNYTFKAYTNYMLNFKEQNHYEQSFSVIYADNESEIKLNKQETNIDVQALPESGHLLYNVVNTLGIIAKNQSGYGVPNLEGRIVDANGTTVSEFKLNQFGIGKTIFTPEINNTYSVEVFKDDKAHTTIISDIKPIGIVMSLSDLQNNKIAINFKTNANSSNTLQSKQLQLAIHNGNELKLYPISLNNALETALVLNYSDLFSGMNIITLFEGNNPILERLFFNYEGIKTATVENVNIKKVNDSLLVQLKIKDLNVNKFNKLSVSVLPSETKSYNHQHNLLSSTYLQPYLKGAIEKGAYYFTNTDRKTKFDLDMLLITQGWSSYDWNTIFNGEVLLNHAFEVGINVIANVNDNTKGGTYIVYPLKNNITKIFQLKSNETKFLQESLIPLEEESFRAGFVNSNNKFKNPGLYLQFYPSKVPLSPVAYNKLSSEPNRNDILNMTGILNQSWERMEILDEVVLEGKARFTKAEKLKQKSVNKKYDILDDRTRMTGMRLSTYLSRIGWSASEIQGQVNISNPRVNWGNSVPLLYLDDVLLNGTTALSGLTLEVIDYIESDFYGLSGGMRGSAGTLKIYTDPSILYRLYPKMANVIEVKFPLTFEKEKKYYTPTYQFYNTTFYKQYGVIGWFSNQTPDSDGNFNLRFLDIKSQSINLYIEGITNDNELVSEVKTINRE